MRYVWKILSLITAFFLLLFGIPTVLLSKLHMWLCRKGDPDFDALSTLLKNVSEKDRKDPEAVGKAVAEMMKVMHPELVEEAKEAADEAVKKHTNRPSFQWGKEPNVAWSNVPDPLPVINPIIPRVPNMPPQPVPFPKPPA